MHFSADAQTQTHMHTLTHTQRSSLPQSVWEAVNDSQCMFSSKLAALKIRSISLWPHRFHVSWARQCSAWETTHQTSSCQRRNLEAKPLNSSALLNVAKMSRAPVIVIHVHSNLYAFIYCIMKVHSVTKYIVHVTITMIICMYSIRYYILRCC